MSNNDSADAAYECFSPELSHIASVWTENELVLPSFCNGLHGFMCRGKVLLKEISTVAFSSPILAGLLLNELE